MKLPEIFLASQSPRRREILTRLGIPFEIIHRKPFDESAISVTEPAEYAETIARLKAQNAIIPPDVDGIVIAFDTIVFIDGEILGKPVDEQQARMFLRKLSGNWHTVFTGVAARKLPEDSIISSVEATRVLFAELTDDEIKVYVASGEPMDKAGAYGIQELGAMLVKRVDGCFYNVVGLPLLCLTELLMQYNIERVLLLRTEVAKTDLR